MTEETGSRPPRLSFMEYGMAGRRWIEEARRDRPAEFVVTLLSVVVVAGVLLALLWPF